MLQSVALCCSVLQCIAVCCSVLQYVAVCCSAVMPHLALISALPCNTLQQLQHTATHPTYPHLALQHTASHCNCNTLQHTLHICSDAEPRTPAAALRCSVVQCVAVSCSVLQCVAVCCSMFLYVAVRCCAPHTPPFTVCCSVL